MKQNETNRTKWYKTFIQALETFNSNGWDSIKGNLNDFKREYEQKIKKLKESWADKDKRMVDKLDL